MDDWTNGRWITAKGRVERVENRLRVHVRPNFRGGDRQDGRGGSLVSQDPCDSRRCDSKMPAPSRFRVYTDSICKPLRVANPVRPASEKTGRNGIGSPGGLQRPVTAVRATDGRGGGLGLRFRVDSGATRTGAIEADLVMASDPIDGRYDRTIVTVRSSARPFSFAADEVARRRPDSRGRSGRPRHGRRRFDLSRRLSRGPPARVRRPDGVRPRGRPPTSRRCRMPGTTCRSNVRCTSCTACPAIATRCARIPTARSKSRPCGRWFSVQRSPRDSERKLWDGEMAADLVRIPA